YAEWNPYQTIEGSAARHAKLKVTPRGLDGKPFPTAQAVIWAFEPGAKLELLGGKPLWFLSLRFFHLTPTECGTLLRHGVKFSGLWARWRFSRDHKIDRLRPYYEAFGKALTD